MDKVERATALRREHEIEQILGKALGYPRYKDDVANFPKATEADGVCVGDHVPVSLAMEIAARLQDVQAKSEERRDVLEAEQYQALAPHNGQESAKPMVCVGCGVHYGDACTPDCAVAKALAD